MNTESSNSIDNKNLDPQIKAGLKSSIGELSPGFMDAFKSKLKTQKPYVSIKGTPDSIWVLTGIGVFAAIGITMMSLYSGDMRFWVPDWNPEWLAYSGYMGLGFAFLAIYHLMGLYEVTQIRKKVLLKS